MFTGFYKWIKRGRTLLLPTQLNKYLSFGLKLAAYKAFDKAIKKFTIKHKKVPNRNEIFRIIINVSHIVSVRRGQKGHWRRQKIRKMLLEEQGIKYAPK